MKLSAETLAVLQNFANINNSIMIREGNDLSTISADKTIVAKANTAEVMPMEFGIYDLSKFLGVVKLYEDQVFEFGEEYVVIRNASNKKQYTRFYYSEPSLILTPPKGKSISFPDDPEVSFDLSQKDFQSLVKGVSVMNLPEVLIKGESGSPVVISGIDSNNSAQGSFNMELETEADSNFAFTISINSLTKLMSGDYEIALSENGIAKFINTSTDVLYYVAVQTGDDDDDEDE